MLGPVVGASCVALVFGAFTGFDTDAILVGAGSALFFTYPATLVFGVPSYFAIRKVRTLRPLWTSAFGMEISLLPVFALRVLGFSPPTPAPNMDLLVYLALGASAALCGAVAGLVFWVFVTRGGKSPGVVET